METKETVKRAGLAQPPALPDPPAQLRAMGEVGSPNTARTLAWTLAMLGAVLVAALIWTPWQQSVSGSGRVSGLRPEEREQDVSAPVDGRILRWHVGEGTKVEQGDLIAEMVDNDPEILNRIGNERRAQLDRLNAGERRVMDHEDRLMRLQEQQLSAVSAAKNRVQVAVDRIRQAEQAIIANQERETAARLNYDRQKQLLDKGLTSTRNVELANQEINTARAFVLQAQAALSAAKGDRAAAEDDLQRIQAAEQAAIQSEKATINSAKAEVANVQATVQQIDVRLARQGTLRIEAPRKGTVLRLRAQPMSQFLKAGESVATFVPDAFSPTVELYLSGMDMPLVQPGDPVRLQFNGWPAVQFVGWPSVAVGTFGGLVSLVDATETNAGKFRVLVVPDPKDAAWPSAQYLRQGVQTKGWVLLKMVPAWWELWRRFNGFPPSLDNEPGKAKDNAKEKAK